MVTQLRYCEGGFEVIPEGVSPSYIEDIHLTMLMDRDWDPLHTPTVKKERPNA